MDPTPASRPAKYIQRVLLNQYPYSHYAYGIYHSAWLASKLGISRMSALEFGVAGGNGLVAMEKHAARIGKRFGVQIDCYGFDTGEGLTPPQDYRDMPYRFAQGNYKMDVPKLTARLTTARLILGDVRETAPKFFDAHSPAPIGFASFDLDYYSSTMDAFTMFGESQEHRFFLPRMQFYFDDIVGTEVSGYNEFVGELAAIRDFNEANKTAKIAESRVFRRLQHNVGWFHQIYLGHRFQHPLYGTYISRSHPGSLALAE